MLFSILIAVLLPTIAFPADGNAPVTPMDKKDALLFYWKSEYNALYKEYAGLVDTHNRLRASHDKLNIEHATQKDQLADLQRRFKYIVFNETDGKTILFKSASHELSEQGKELLNSVVDMVRMNYGSLKQMIVVGHTDNVPVRDHKHLYKDNLDLSYKRAAAVYRYIRDAIQDPRLDRQSFVSGRGEHEPVTDNKDDAGKAQNRRVEVLLIFK